MGPNRHVLTFPISGGTIMNMVAFVTTTEDWPNPEKNVKPGTREDCLRDFDGFGYNVTSLLKLTNEDLSIVCIPSPIFGSRDLLHSSLSRD
jgi:salicylate hydroxylase